MAVINTNVKALFSQMALGSSGRAQSVAMQQLSTGKRINSARDDAAGMAIATRMTQQIRSLNQAVRNAGDAISLIQTAEGATNEITDMMQRMRELAIQAVNDTNNNDQRSYLDLEFQQLKQQIVQIAGQTEWNGFPVLDGSAGERVGEMPVYKVTSNNQFGDVFIDPTTTRTIGGAGGGETQSITLSLTAGAQDAASYVTVDGGPLGKVQVQLTPAEVAAGLATVTAKIANVLNNSQNFGGNSGRSVAIDGATPGKLNFTFAASDGDLEPIHIDGGATKLNSGNASEVRKSVTAATEVFTGNGKFLQSGSLRVAVDTSNKVTASFLNSQNEVISMTGTLAPATGKVTFDVKQGLNASVISDSLTYTLQDASGTALNLSATARALSLNVDVAGSIPSMRAGDLIINGVTIGPSNASDDKLSPANNAAGSAIAKAAAINRMAVDQGFSQGESQSITFASNLILPGTITVGGVNIAISPDDNTPVLVAKKVALALKASPQFEPGTGRAISWAEGSAVVNINYPVTDGDVKPVEVSPGNTALVTTVRTVQNYAPNVPGTGVFAKVNENVLTGQAMQGTSVVTGRVFINGYASADIASVLNNPRATREAVVRAINLITDRTGVRAVDTGSDEKGITLTAADGRNIEVRFETPNNAADFGQRIGLREGVQSSTISLESKIDAPVVLSSSSIGDIQRVGLDAGNYSKNQAVMNTQQRSTVEPAVAQVSTVKISGTGSLAANESMIVVLNGIQFKVEASAAMTAQEVRAALLAELNGPDGSKTGVLAAAGASSDEIQLTAKTPGLAYTLSANKLPTTSTSLIGIVAKEVIPNETAQYKSLGLNDLQINGINIRATTLEDDKYSTRDVSSSDPASSAIALAAAINASTAETGVRAEPNPVTIVGGTTLTKLPAGDAEGKSKQSLWINGVEIKVDFVANESVTARVDRVVAAINEYSGPSGVKATNNGNGVTLNSDGRNVAVWFDSSVKDLSAASFGLDKGGTVAQVSKVTFGGTSTSAGTASLMINGVQVTSAQTANPATPALLAAAMITAINNEVNDPASPLKNVTAEVSADGNSLLIKSTVAGTAFDVRGTDVGTGNALTMAVTSVTANSNGKNDVNAIDLSDAYKNNVLGGVSNASNVKTLYGTVKLIAAAPNLPTMPGADGLKPNVVGASGRPITITTGGDGLGALSNFSALGFNEGIFGGRASTEMEPPRVGRMAFQVGSSANQIITIDLADFGKNGSITGEITGDVDRDVETRSVRINTKDGATAVLNLLDRAMDKVNATRATMGAVMNRLDHVINNLTNVSMNMSASRSQIEDSDYAAASTELAKTQIMQQAATAVLAQANTSQQSVLKLLGG